MKERPLISTEGLLAFTLAIVGLLYSLVPSDSMLGILKAGSYDNKTAEALFRRSTSLNSTDADAIKNLADTLETQGEIGEAARFVKRLTELKPRNLSYRHRLIKLLHWSGRPLEATRAQEYLLMNDLEKTTREAFLKLASDYEWLQASEDRDRIYLELVKRKLYLKPDVISMLRVYFTNGDIEAAQKLYHSALESQIIGKEMTYDMVRLFVEFNQPEKAVQELSRYVGTPPDRALAAWTDTGFFSQLSVAEVHREQRLLVDIYLSYAARNQEALAFPLLEHMGKSNLLNPDAQIVLGELLMEKGRPKEALQELRKVMNQANVSNGQWQKLVKLFQSLGAHELAAQILEALLEGRSPALTYTDKKNSSRTWHSLGLYAELTGDTLQDVPKEIPAGLEKTESVLRGTGRKLALQQLVAIYEKSGQQEKSLSAMERLLEESKRRNIALSFAEELELRERLAERYLWKSKPESVVLILKPVPFQKLSAKTKSIKTFALMDLKQDVDAIASANMISAKERKTLDNSATKRLSQIDKLGSDRKKAVFEKKLNDQKALAAAAAARKANGNQVAARPRSTNRGLAQTSAPLPPTPLTEPTRSVRDSAYNDLLYQPKNLSLTSTTLVSSGSTSTSLDLKWRKRLKDSRWGWSSRAVGQQIFFINRSIGSVRLGGEYASDSALYRLEAGYQEGGKFIHPQAFGSVSGSLLLFDYGTLSVDLAKSLGDSQLLAENGVSETRTELYCERRVTRWLELTGGALGRLTHLGNDLNRGRGVETTVKLGFLDKDSRWRIGPYAYLLWWGSASTVLKPLLASRYTIVGAFGSVNWGGTRKYDIRGHFAAGLGPDFSVDAKNRNSFLTGYLETYVEKLISNEVAVKIEYARYIAGTTQTLGTGSHVMRGSLVWGFQ